MSRYSQSRLKTAIVIPVYSYQLQEEFYTTFFSLSAIPVRRHRHTHIYTYTYASQLPFLSSMTSSSSIPSLLLCLLSSHILPSFPSYLPTTYLPIYLPTEQRDQHLFAA